jgi:hypothetical protein
MKQFTIKAKSDEDLYKLHRKTYNKKANCCNYEVSEMYSLNGKDWMCRDCMMEFLYSNKARIVVVK